MTLALILKLAAFLAAPLALWLLRRSGNPLARKLLTSVGPRTDHANMTAAQVQDTARRFMLFGLAAGGTAALILALAHRLVHRTESQAAAAIAVLVLAFLCFIYLVNSAQFALIAFNKRAAERRLAGQGTPPGSLHPR